MLFLELLLVMVYIVLASSMILYKLIQGYSEIYYSYDGRPEARHSTIILFWAVPLTQCHMSPAWPLLCLSARFSHFRSWKSICVGCLYSGFQHSSSPVPDSLMENVFCVLQRSSGSCLVFLQENYFLQYGHWSTLIWNLLIHGLKGL